MSNATATFLFHGLVYVIIAWVSYAIDRKVGKALYHKWYNLSHEQPLAPDVIRGFICGRAGKAKCTMAVVISLIVTIGMSALSKETSTIAWFFTWLIGIVATVLGFITAPLAANLWGKRIKVYEAVDNIEAGDPGKKIIQKTGSVFSRVSKWWHENRPGSTAVITTPEITSTAAALPPPANVGADIVTLDELLSSAPTGNSIKPPPVTSAVPAKSPALSGQAAIDRFTGRR